MSIKIKLQEDVKSALKAGDPEKRVTLSLILSAIKSKELEKRTKLSKSVTDTDELEKQSTLGDEEVLEVLSSEIKKRKDSVEQYEKGGRPELAEKEKKEIDLLMAYMPEQIGEDELKNIIIKTKEEVGASSPKDMGKLIGAVMPKVKGKADGTLVSKLVKESLS